MIKLGVSFISGKLWVTPKIWNNNLNKLSAIAMLFDTGATMTTIDVGIANRAGISLKNAEEIAVRGIGGIVNGHLVTIKEFYLGGVNIGTIAAHVIPFSADSEVQAVIGMNVLRGFKTTIDLQHKTEDGSGAIFLEPTFDINDVDTPDTFMLKSSRFGIWNAEQYTTIADGKIQDIGELPKKDLPQAEFYIQGSFDFAAKHGGYELLMVYGKHKKHIEKKDIAGNSDVSMILEAVIDGLQMLKKPCEVIVFSNTLFGINAVYRKGKLRESIRAREANFNLKVQLLKILKDQGHVLDNLVESNMRQMIKDIKEV